MLKVLRLLSITAVVVVYTIFNSLGALAIPAIDLHDLNRGTPAYKSNGDDDCSAGGGSSGGTGDSSGAGDTYVAWDSGIEGPYIMEQYVIQVLKYIAAFKSVPEDQVVTKEHVLALLAWAWGEGGDINNSSVFNLFNSGALAGDPEAHAYGGGGHDGRQSYTNFDTGIKATGGNILGGGAGNPERYSRVVNILLDQNSTASQVLDAYTHYSRYPNNSWWAQANETVGEDAYYQRELGLLAGMKNNYRERASTAIGTPALEQFAGPHYPEKLVFDGTGAAVDNPSSGTGSSSGSSSSSNDSTNTDSSASCNDSPTPGGSLPGDASKCAVGKGGDVTITPANAREVTTGSGETITLCDYGGVIGVNSTWSPNMANMLALAKSEGLTLNGGGFRTAEEQIALRRAHCGSSHYAIYEMPSSSCHPPTARPGTSNHEKGLAIDFSNCNSHSTPCYKWLAANAGKFDIHNFPKEAWHWSYNGK